MVSPSSSSRKRQLSTTPANNDDTAADAGEYLLDRLRILLSRLQTTAEILQNWPETSSAQQGNDSAKVHAETSTELIASIRKIALGIRSIERHVNGTAGGGGGGTGSSSTAAAADAFRTSLEENYPIPLDLLDLLDVGQPTFGLNPQCYARGLIVEALRQLSVLERRKRAASMLAIFIEEGLTKSDVDNDVDEKLKK